MRILLGIDGSDRSRRALEGTVERVAETGDELTVAIFDSEDVEVTPADIEAEARDTLAAADLEADVRQLSGSGHPGGEIVGLAETEDYDRLVIDGGKRSPLGKIKLGQVAEFVILNAEMPVTLFR